MKLSLDFETRSTADLKKCGAFRYAEHPSTEVLVIAVSLGPKQPIHTWDIRQPIKGNKALELLGRAIHEGWEIHAFNSQFEWCILKHVCPRQFSFPVPDINTLRCTAALCRSAGLPPSLEKCAEFLKLEIQKDKLGKVLIGKFSVPQKGKEGSPGTSDPQGFIQPQDDVAFTAGGAKMTAPEAFQKFVDYCARDVETEMAVAEAMKCFELKGDMLDSFLFDARMNDRGVPVCREALIHANTLVDQHSENLSNRFRDLTGLSPSQTAKTLAWIQERGYPGKSLNVESREKYQKSPALTEEGRLALRLRAELSFAAVKKIPTMLNWVMDDGFIRGSFLWYGAQKTGRWTSKGPQWQNLKKCPKKLRRIIEHIFGEVRGGITLDELDLLYGNPYEVIASLSRLFVRFEDVDVFDLDYSSVEAKILPMLIECRRILDRFDSGEDVYVTTAKSLSAKFNKPLNRDDGKVCVLATQFQGGWRAVFTATGKTWSQADCEAAVAIIRKDNPEFPRAWRAMHDSFVEAFHNPGRRVQATKYTAFLYTEEAPFARMAMIYPSGREQILPLPNAAPITMVQIEKTDKATGKKKASWVQVDDHVYPDDLPIVMQMGHPFFYPDTIVKSSFFTHDLSFYGHIEGATYGRVSTYGGDCLQTYTQGTGADLLMQGCINADRKGFNPFLAVHDQCLTPAIGDKEELVKALCHVPDWFAGFPLEATADIERSYCKN